MDLEAEPAQRVRFFLQAHDAICLRHRTGDFVDLRQGYLEYGDSEGAGWSIRVGRQELSFCDERLLGSDTDWADVGFTFDGAAAR